MDKFDKIIKDKLEEFEVPYNEAHWAEMDGKLESMRIAKIKKTVLSIAAGIIGLSLAAYLIVPNVMNEKGIAASTDDKSVVNIDNNNVQSDNNNPKNTTTDNQTEESPSTSNETPLDDNTNHSDESNIENETVVIENNLNESSLTELTENNEKDIENNSIPSEIEAKDVNPDFIVFNNKVCLGEKVSFEPMTTDGPYSYLWNFGDGKISHKTTPSHTYEHSGNYDITLTVIDRQSGKEYTEIKRSQVVILDSETGSFTYIEESKKHDDNKLSYPYTLFKVKSDCEDCDFKWNFGNGVTANGKNPKNMYKKEGGYNVTLITENSNGCINTIERRVTIKDGINLYAPNALKVSSEFTENSVFIPKALTEWDITFEMVINNKAGRTIYQTSDNSEPWNGKLNNTGQLMPEGLYFWQVVITDAYGVKHTFQGDINLIK